MKKTGPLLSLNPSSCETGWAVINLDTGILFEAGAARPPREHVRSKADVRSEILAEQVGGLLLKYEPSVVLVEVPSSHSKYAKRRVGQQRLSSYALAVCDAVRECKAYCDGLGTELHLIEPSDWICQVQTNGKSRAGRVNLLAVTEIGYDRASDPEGVIADAIMMGHWWWTHRSKQEAGAA